MPGRNVVWHPADGTAPLTLSDRPAGYRMMAGATGLDAPPYDVTTEAVPGWDGEQLRSVRVESRRIRWPMLIAGGTRNLYRIRARRLLSKLDPTKGAGRLELQEADGTRRFLSCIYTGGLEGDGALTASGDGRWQRAVLSFLAVNPWWTDGELRTVEFPYRDGPASTFFPILPLSVSSSQVMGETGVSNPGDVDAWPIWLVEPPSLGVVLTRMDTGEVVALSGSVPASDVLQIVTEPGLQSIRLVSGQNRWPNLLDGSTLWRIPAGATPTPISIAVDGAAPGSKVTLSFYPRYRSAL